MNEMTLLRMDPGQRHAWLMANRATLMTVGVLLLAWIAAELLAGRTPVAAIVLIPLIALIRWGFYRHYRRHPGSREARSDGA